MKHSLVVNLNRSLKVLDSVSVFLVKSFLNYEYIELSFFLALCPKMECVKIFCVPKMVELELPI